MSEFGMKEGGVLRRNLGKRRPSAGMSLAVSKGARVKRNKERKRFLSYSKSLTSWDFAGGASKSRTGRGAQLTKKKNRGSLYFLNGYSKRSR